MTTITVAQGPCCMQGHRLPEMCVGPIHSLQKVVQGKKIPSKRLQEGVCMHAQSTQLLFALLKLEDNKQALYAELLGKLHTNHAHVTFVPLACSYNGALALDTWILLMNCLELRPKAQENVLRIAIRNICIAFSTMAYIRRGCLVATNQSSPSDSRHTGRV